METGFYLNATIEKEIAIRTNALNAIHDKSNWTKEEELKEVILNNEIQDLLMARQAYANFYNN